MKPQVEHSSLNSRCTLCRAVKLDKLCKYIVTEIKEVVSTTNLRLGLKQIYPTAVYNTEKKKKKLAMVHKFLVKFIIDF